MDAPDALVIRVGLRGRRQILVDAHTVEEIIPSEGKLRFGATPTEVDLPIVLQQQR